MRQVLGPGALGRPRGIGWRGRWEGGWGWGIHVNPCLIRVNVWQKPLQYCKVISLQLIKINGKKKGVHVFPETTFWYLFVPSCILGICFRFVFGCVYLLPFCFQCMVISLLAVRTITSSWLLGLTIIIQTILLCEWIGLICNWLNLSWFWHEEWLLSGSALYGKLGKQMTFKKNFWNCL